MHQVKKGEGTPPLKLLESKSSKSEVIEPEVIELDTSEWKSKAPTRRNRKLFYTPSAEIQLNSETSGDQSNPLLGVLPGGGFMVTWINHQNNTYNQINTNRFSSTGVALGTEFQATSNIYGPISQTPQGLITFTAGDYVLTWFSAGTMYYKHGGADLSFSYPLSPSSATGVIAFPSGDFAIFNGVPGKTSIQMFAYGNIAGSSLHLGGVTNASLSPYPIVSSNNFAMVWETTSPATPAITLQSYTPSGGSSTQVNSNSNTNLNPVVDIFPSGNLVVAWTSQGAGGSKILARQFSSAGVALSSETPISTCTAPSNPYVRAINNYSYAAIWQCNNQVSPTSGFDIYMRLMSTTGTPLTAELPVNSYTTGDQSMPVLTVLPSGDIVCAWQSANQTSSNSGWDVMGKIYQNQPPTLSSSSWVIHQGERTPIIPSMINLVDDGDPRALTATITGNLRGTFGLVSDNSTVSVLTQQQLSTQQYFYQQDGSPFPPVIFLTISDGFLTLPATWLNPPFYRQPFLTSNQLTIGQGTQVPLTPTIVDVADDYPDDQVRFTVVNLVNGEVTPSPQFTRAELRAGARNISHTGSQPTMGYSIIVNDPFFTIGPIPSEVSVIPNLQFAKPLTKALPPQAYDQGQAISFSLPPNSFVDPSGGPIQLLSALENGTMPLPSGLEFTPASGTFTGAIDSPGNFNLSVTAANNQGLIATSFFTLEILAQKPTTGGLSSGSSGGFDPKILMSSVGGLIAGFLAFFGYLRNKNITRQKRELDHPFANAIRDALQLTHYKDFTERDGAAFAGLIHRLSQLLKTQTQHTTSIDMDALSVSDEEKDQQTFREYVKLFAANIYEEVTTYKLGWGGGKALRLTELNSKSPEIVAAVIRQAAKQELPPSLPLPAKGCISRCTNSCLNQFSFLGAASRDQGRKRGSTIGEGRKLETKDREGVQLKTFGEPSDTGPASPSILPSLEPGETTAFSSFN